MLRLTELKLPLDHPPEALEAALTQYRTDPWPRTEVMSRGLNMVADIARRDAAAARGYREQVKRCGVQVGPKALDADQRATYFATLKALAADAENRGDYEAAVADLRLFLEGGRALVQLPPEEFFNSDVPRLVEFLGPDPAARANALDQ